MTDINASTPVVVPAQAGVTYDKWYITQINARISPAGAPLNVHLTHAVQNPDGSFTLMPKGQNSDIYFTVDAWKEMVNTPEIAAAIEAVQTAVIAYGQKNNLL